MKKTTTSFQTTYETENDGKETMQNSILFSQRIPSPFKIAEEVGLPVKIVVETLGSIAQEDRPAVTDGEILDYIQLKFGDQTATMLKIMDCESGGNPEAINWGDAEITGMPSLGLFQLNRPYDEKYFDPVYNISEAFKLYQKRGFQPWSCAKKLGII